MMSLGANCIIRGNIVEPRNDDGTRKGLANLATAKSNYAASREISAAVPPVPVATA